MACILYIQYINIYFPQSFLNVVSIRFRFLRIMIRSDHSQTVVADHQQNQGHASDLSDGPVVNEGSADCSLVSGECFLHIKTD